LEPSTTLVRCVFIRIIFNLHLINSTWVDLIIILYFILKKFMDFGICDMETELVNDDFIAETTTWVVIEKFVWRTKRKAFLSVNAPTYGWHILSLVLFVQSYLIWIAIIPMFKVIISYGKSSQTCSICLNIAITWGINELNLQ